MTEEANFQAVLAAYKARRARLDRIIADMEAELAGQPADTGQGLPEVDLVGAAASGTASVAIHPDAFFGQSIIEAAKKYLRMARRAQHLTAIAAALEQGGLKRPTDNVLSGILVRAAKGREVVKVGKGLWGLSEWYPKPPKEPSEDRQKRPADKPVKAAKRVKAPKKAQLTRSKDRVTATEKASARPSEIAMEIMRTAGKPLHVAEVTKRLNERGVPTPRLPIESFLNRQVKAGKLQKVSPSVFAMAG